MIACTAPPSLYIHWNSESMLLVLRRQRCVQAGHWTVHTQLIFLHDQKNVRGTLPGQHRALLRCSFLRCCICTKACKCVTCSSRRACCSFQPCIFESERQRSRSAPCEGTRDSPTHRCHNLAVAGSRIAERSTRRCQSASKGTASTS